MDFKVLNKRPVTVISITVILLLLFIGFLIPQSPQIPVSGATVSDWNANTFWYEPWGKSGVHKGIDIFGAKGTDIISSTQGLVLYQGQWGRGGNVALVLGPKWRLHYYAHLAQIAVHTGQFVTTGEVIGQVGDSGNAQGKAPHLHYSVVTLVPYPWRIDSASQGWKKMFFLDPAADVLGY